MSYTVEIKPLTVGDLLELEKAQERARESGGISPLVEVLEKLVKVYCDGEEVPFREIEVSALKDIIQKIMDHLSFPNSASG